ncbi:MAG: hypothetical protein MJ025_04820 [Victivallaceae bacterium]|nr:hypothetical protein [Victivallaceae bacterium]
MKALVVYFSWGGHTAKAAKTIAAAAGADVFELVSSNPYPADYGECVARARREKAADAVVQVVEMPDVSGYDMVFVGSPNWCGTMAKPVAYFLGHTDLSGKVVAPFFTHGGGFMQRCESDAAQLAKGAMMTPAITIRDKEVDSSLDELAEFAKKSLASAGK